jgi:hypothetical protein
MDCLIETSWVGFLFLWITQ